MIARGTVANGHVLAIWQHETEVLADPQHVAIEPTDLLGSRELLEAVRLQGAVYRTLQPQAEELVADLTPDVEL